MKLSQYIRRWKWKPTDCPEARVEVNQIENKPHFLIEERVVGDRRRVDNGGVCVLGILLALESSAVG